MATGILRWPRRELPAVVEPVLGLGLSPGTGTVPSMAGIMPAELILPDSMTASTFTGSEQTVPSLHYVTSFQYRPY